MLVSYLDKMFFTSWLWPKDKTRQGTAKWKKTPTIPSKACIFGQNLTWGRQKLMEHSRYFSPCSLSAPCPALRLTLAIKLHCCWETEAPELQGRSPPTSLAKRMKKRGPCGWMIGLPQFLFHFFSLSPPPHPRSLSVSLSLLCSVLRVAQVTKKGKTVWSGG